MISFALILFIVVSPVKFAATVKNAEEERESKLVHRYGAARGLKSVFEWRYGGENIINEVNFYLYTKNTLSNPVISKVTSEVLFDGKLDVLKPVKILIHGYKSSRNELFAKTVREAYIQSASYNIIVVEWSWLSNKIYPLARGFVPEVGKIIAQFIDKLGNQTGLRADQVHIIGHSVGAHIAGVAGLIAQSGKLRRITGLDPAGPLFSNKDHDLLRPECATFVDVIHTSGNRLGMLDPMGHIDFYPNEGVSPQPGCEKDIGGTCSHSRSAQLYAESIVLPNAFIGTKCDGWEDYIKGACDTNPTARMGENVSFLNHSIPGKYWLRTSQASPYGFGPFSKRGRSLQPQKQPTLTKILTMLIWPIKHWSSYLW